MLSRPVTLSSLSWSTCLMLLVVSLVANQKGLSLNPEAPAVLALFPSDAFDVTAGLLRRGSLTLPSYQELYDYLLRESARTGGYYWQDVFSRAVNGQLVSYHSLLLPILALPFFALFGEFGYWIMTQLMIVLTFISIFKLTEEMHGSKNNLRMVLLVFACSPLLLYSYSYSYDVLACMLAVSGLAISYRHSFWGNCLVGLSVFARPTQVLYLPFVIVGSALAQRSMRAFFWGCFGAGLSTGLFLIVNKLLWGGFFTTGYDLMIAFSNGHETLRLGLLHFSWEELFSNWWEKLFHEKAGLIYHPGLFVLPFILAVGARRISPSPESAFAWSAFIAGLCQFALFYSYVGWDATYCGSRYLLGASFYILLPALGILKSTDLRCDKSRT